MHLFTLSAHGDSALSHWLTARSLSVPMRQVETIREVPALNSGVGR